MPSLFSVRVLRSSEEIQQWHKKPSDHLTYQIKGRCNVFDKWKPSWVPIEPTTLIWVRSGREKMCCLWMERVWILQVEREHSRRKQVEVWQKQQRTPTLFFTWSDFTLRKVKKEVDSFHSSSFFFFPFKKILGIGHHFAISSI